MADIEKCDVDECPYRKVAGKYCNGAELDSVIRCIELLKR